MSNNRTRSNTDSNAIASQKAQAIYLGIDAHKELYVVSRKLDGQTPQPPQRFSLSKLKEFVLKQLELGQSVYACYEAGPFGYGLHRWLESGGVKNVVVVPQEWEGRKKVKTDKLDARSLVQRLFNYVQGDRSAFSTVRIPTEEQERKRAQSRHRQQLLEHRKSLSAQGMSLLLTSGLSIGGRSWWKPAHWEQVQSQAHPETVALLSNLRQLILEIEKMIGELKAQIEKAAQDKPVPRGLGRLSWEEAEREVLDWARFTNRRQPASYTGLCPSESSSGGAPGRRQGSITKYGNPRLRVNLVEMSWRMLRYQPNYRLVLKWRERMLEANHRRNRAQKKKIIIAFARELAVDLWRLATGRTTPEKLGLVM